MTILKRILKLIAKLALMPVMLLIILMQWIGLFLNSISGVVFGILSFLFWSISLMAWIFGQASGEETLRMMIVAFFVFIIPHIGNWIIERIIVLRCILGDFMRS